jgi:hypothetical protein
VADNKPQKAKFAQRHYERVEIARILFETVKQRPGDPVRMKCRMEKVTSEPEG